MDQIFKKRFARVSAVVFFVMLLTTGLFGVAKPAHAQFGGGGLMVPVNDITNNSKEWGLDQAAWIAAKMLIESISDSLVDWINSGFEGNPGFIQNPGKFFTGVADQVAGNFIAGSELGFLCEPFRLDIRFALSFNYTASFDRKIGCTLSDVLQNAQNFTDFTQGDFSKGGWSGWLSVSQNSQNNPYGAYIQSEGELSARISGSKNIELLKLDWGKGFLSMQDENGNIQTPGTLIENQLALSLGSDVRQLELADEFNEILMALGGQLIGQVFTSGSGLVNANPQPSPPPGDPDVIGWCEANKTIAQIGENVRWRVGVASGGAANATFWWGGNAPMNLHPTTQNVDVNDYGGYTTEGIKTARVRITVNGQTETIECRNAVTVEANP